MLDNLTQSVLAELLRKWSINTNHSCWWLTGDATNWSYCSFRNITLIPPSNKTQCQWLRKQSCNMFNVTYLMSCAPPVDDLCLYGDDLTHTFALLLFLFPKRIVLDSVQQADLFLVFALSVVDWKCNTSLSVAAVFTGTREPETLTLPLYVKYVYKWSSSLARPPHTETDTHKRTHTHTHMHTH